MKLKVMLNRPTRPRLKCVHGRLVRSASGNWPCHTSMATIGISAKKERQKTISPAGMRSATAFTQTSMSVNTNVEAIFSAMPRPGFIEAAPITRPHGSPARRGESSRSVRRDGAVARLRQAVEAEGDQPERDRQQDKPAEVLALHGLQRIGETGSFLDVVGEAAADDEAADDQEYDAAGDQAETAERPQPAHHVVAAAEVFFEAGSHALDDVGDADREEDRRDPVDEQPADAGLDRKSTRLTPV